MATHDFITICDTIAICILNNYATIAIADLTSASIWVDASTCICRSCIIVASFCVLTTDQFIAVTNAITIRIQNVYTSFSVANLAVAIGECTRASIRGSRIVVASFSILASDDFIAISNAVAISILNNHTSFAVTDFTSTSFGVEAFACISRGSVIVASLHVLAALDLIAIANAITISILNSDSAIAVANFAVAISIDTGASVCCACIVVASFHVLATDNFIAVAYAIAIDVLCRNATIAIANLAIAVSVKTAASIGCRDVVVASHRVLTAHDLIRVANAIAVGIQHINSTFSVAYLAVAIRINAITSIGCRGVVVTSRHVLATSNFVCIANTVTVSIQHVYSTISIANFTVAIRIGAISSISCRRVVVTSHGVLTS